MQALVLNDNSAAQAATAMALFKRNFQVVTADDVEVASAYADLGVFDLVVMAERVRGRLSHSVALSAELRNPHVTTMMVTPRADEEVDELFELLPSLYCLLGDKLSPEMVAKMAVSGVVGCPPVSDRAPVAAQTAIHEDAPLAGQVETTPVETTPAEPTLAETTLAEPILAGPVGAMVETREGSAPGEGVPQQADETAGVNETPVAGREARSAEAVTAEPAPGPLEEPAAAQVSQPEAHEDAGEIDEVVEDSELSPVMQELIARARASLDAHKAATESAGGAGAGSAGPARDQAARVLRHAGVAA